MAHNIATKMHTFTSINCSVNHGMSAFTSRLMLKKRLKTKDLGSDNAQQTVNTVTRAFPMESFHDTDIIKLNNAFAMVLAKTPFRATSLGFVLNGALRAARARGCRRRPPAVPVLYMHTARLGRPIGAREHGSGPVRIPCHECASFIRGSLFGRRRPLGR